MLFSQGRSFKHTEIMAKKKRKSTIRQRLANIERNKVAEDQRLALLAKELGVAGMMVLVNDYGWSREQANEWLGKLIEQAKTNRLMITTETVLGAYDVINKDGKDNE